MICLLKTWLRFRRSTWSLLIAWYCTWSRDRVKVIWPVELSVSSRLRIWKNLLILSSGVSYVAGLSERSTSINGTCSRRVIARYWTRIKGGEFALTTTEVTILAVSSLLLCLSLCLSLSWSSPESAYWEDSELRVLSLSLLFSLSRFGSTSPGILYLATCPRRCEPNSERSKDAWMISARVLQYAILSPWRQQSLVMRSCAQC